MTREYTVNVPVWKEVPQEYTVNVPVERQVDGDRTRSRCR